MSASLEQTGGPTGVLFMWRWHGEFLYVLSTMMVCSQVQEAQGHRGDVFQGRLHARCCAGHLMRVLLPGHPGLHL